MDTPEAEALNHTETTEDAAPTTSSASSQEEDGPKPKNIPRKRKAEKPANARAKKHKKPRVSQPAQPAYTVHQGEDMLLVISNSTSRYGEGSAWFPPKKGRKKKKLVKGKMKAVKIKKKNTVRVRPKAADYPVKEEKEETHMSEPQTATDHRWGQSLPEEVLINIFQLVVDQDGAVPFLCRVGRVCRLWNAAASSPVLWRKVTVAHCWIAPGKTQLPKTEKKIKDTVDWLAQNRFTQLRDFSVCHWKKLVNYAVQVVSQSCPHLRSLTVSYCVGLTTKVFQCLGLHSQSLQSINLQYSEFEVEGLVEYLENHGDQIKQILFTHGKKTDRLLTAISRGCCPNLEVLEVNTKLDSKDCELHVCIQALQTACPKLKTFRMLNVRPRQRTKRNAGDSELGFPLLEELCIATASYSYLSDKDLWDILFGSTKLRVLDLRGCSRITPSGLAALPCLDLECLFWGQYFTVNSGLSSFRAGIHLVAQKWCQTLQQLDIANQVFTEQDLEIAMSHLAQATQSDTLRSLNLSGTKITSLALRSLISQTTGLKYLNLSSCRQLPRGLKRIYRGQEEIQQLFEKLE